MRQLEKRNYSRQEISELLEVNINDNKHFKRNLTNKLDKLGYKYKYSTKVVEILEVPQTAEDRLREIFIREFSFDPQTDIRALACFLVSLDIDPIFAAMPWEERANELRNNYGVSVADITLKKWYSTLLKKEMVMVDKTNKADWATFYVDGDKQKVFIEPDDPGLGKYYGRRNELVRQYKDNCLLAGRKDTKKINSEAWTFAFKTLWEEFHCCYYRCNTIILNALGDYFQEIYDLVLEITE